jgi:hypothetical protein
MLLLRAGIRTGKTLSGQKPGHELARIFTNSFLGRTPAHTFTTWIGGIRGWLFFFIQDGTVAANSGKIDVRRLSTH